MSQAPPQLALRFLNCGLSPMMVTVCHYTAGRHPPEYRVRTFGDRLRQHREQQGLSLEAISASTKISTRMLAAIEDERFDQLPGGVFNKGFVRAYARQVGLDEDQAVAEYLAALHDSQLPSQTLTPNFRRDPPPATSPDSAPRQENPATGLGIELKDRRAQSDRRLQSRRRTDPPNLYHPQASHTNHFPIDRPSVELASIDRDIDDRPVENHFQETHPSQAAAHFDEDSFQRPAEFRSADHNTAREDYRGEYSEESPTPPPSCLNLSAYHDADQRESDFPTHAPGSPRVRWKNLAIPLIVLSLVLALWGLHRRQIASSAESSSEKSAQEKSLPAESSPESSQIAASQASPPNPAPKIFQSSKATAHRSADATSPAAKATPSHPTPVPTAAPPTTPTHPRSKPPKPIPAFTLLIHASRTSWVSITADGQPVAQETLIAPAHTSVRATQEIVVKTRNAGALSFSLNHLEISPQGAEGESRTYVFNAHGLLNSSPAQPAVTR